MRAQGDALPDNDRLEQSVWVGPRPRVLYVEGQPQTSQYLRDALVREGLDVSVVAPEGLPASSAALDPFDAVIVSDLSPQDTAAPRTCKRCTPMFRPRGGGPIFAAVENTFGESGFSGTPPEKVSPVEFKSEEKRKDLALVLCLDRSYSMKGWRIAQPKAGARAALNLLEEQHYFGVIAFDSEPHEAVPLEHVRSKRRAEELDRPHPGEWTEEGPPRARHGVADAAEPPGLKRKHVIVLSDGDTAPAEYDRLLKRMQDARSRSSLVTIGRTGQPRADGADRPVWAGARPTWPRKLEQVPRAVRRGHAAACHRPPLMVEPFRPVVKVRPPRRAAWSSCGRAAVAGLRQHQGGRWG